MGINAVKGVEIGAGFEAVDAARHDARRRADAGRLSRQQRRRRARRHLDRPGHHRLARDQADQLDPQPAPLDRPRRASRPSVETLGRHDPCVGIRAAPIAEAMLALVLMDHVLRHRAQCGDVRVAVRADSRPGALTRRAPAPRGRRSSRSLRSRSRTSRYAGLVEHLRPALVPGPRLLDLRDRRPDLAAKLDAPLHARTRGAGWPTTPGGANASCASPPGGSLLASVGFFAPVDYAWVATVTVRALRLHRRCDSDQRGGLAHRVSSGGRLDVGALRPGQHLGLGRLLRRGRRRAASS